MGDVKSLDSADKMDAANQIFVGSFIHSKSLDTLEYLHDAAVAVDSNGKIVAIWEAVTDESEIRQRAQQLGWDGSSIRLQRRQPGQFFFPGFIGTRTPSMVAQGFWLPTPVTHDVLIGNLFPRV